MVSFANADSGSTRDNNRQTSEMSRPATTTMAHASTETSLWSGGPVSLGTTEERHGSFRSDSAGMMRLSNLATTAGLGSVPVQPGEFDGVTEFERPTSAPPPGFLAGPEERGRMAEELLLWGPKQLNEMHSSDRAHVSGDRNSFTDLAAVLGAELTDAMNEKDAAPKFSKDDINYHRQTRHAASRLVGASVASYKEGTFSDHKAPTAPLFGNSFFSMNTGVTSSGDGFPTSLSSPDRDKAVTDQEASRRQELRGSTTPIDMVPGQQKPGQRRNVPLSKDIGTRVVEPDADNQFIGLSGVVSRRVDHNNNDNNNINSFPMSTGSNFSGDGSLDHMWSLNAPEFKPSLRPPMYNSSDDGNNSLDSTGGQSEISAQQAENELRHFLWDIDRNKASRTLAVLRVSWLRGPDVRTACEAYGVLENFRSDFSSRGIYFVSYYDIRSAQYAAAELHNVLQRMLLVEGNSEEPVVRYCLPLNSSSQFDEGQIHLSDVPPEITEGMVAQMLSSYGAVRSLFRQTPGSYLVEFQNIQDAKQALLELESSQPLGPLVNVEMGARHPVERKRGRELLAMLGRWRQGMSQAAGHMRNVDVRPQQYNVNVPSGMNDPWMSSDGHVGGVMMGTPVDMQGFGGAGGSAYGGTARQNGTAQVVRGPDGRYRVVMGNNSSSLGSNSFGGNNSFAMETQRQQQQPQQQIIQGPNGQLYVTSIPVHPTSDLMMQPQAPIQLSQGNYQSVMTTGRPMHTATPYYTHVVHASDAGSFSNRSYGSARSATSDKDNRHLTLDLDAVESDMDTRTSLMVRNIPNKYTQQMLLSEFEENGHGPGIIDFFYLPIDFKNRCNRGYAFINFVDYKDILSFHRLYFGKHWRTFNSDKICDITYARIQGKAAMLKRFENSALMEKDEEYKPLVFVSDGPNKGQRLPFPGPGSASAPLTGP